MRKFLALLLIFCGLTMAAKNDNFMLRAYTTRGDTTAWVGLDSVAVMISAVNDTVKVPFKLLSGNREELMTDNGGEIRAMIQGGVGKYMLTLDREGYEPVVKEFERKYRDQSTVWIGTISMQKERHKELNEVEVVATAIKMVMKGDTVVYNANAFNLAEGSMLEALIRQLPNAQLNSDGEITVNGRKINSLLINGKDFFNGDMDVAMKNLPSYTVKNIQVYDKASEDDYLTQSSQKLARKEDEENLVMDVVLKKEYSIGTMASVEGGYGTDNRWLGKLFGLGFTETLRLSAFGNFNNVRDNSSVGTRGEWNNDSGYYGDGRVEKGGMDYLYEPESKKLRANGNVVFTYVNNLNLNETASTLFYPTGDLYRRSATRNNNRNYTLNTHHTFFFKGESAFLNIRPTFNWSRNRTNNLNRSATFTEMPEESSRTESLDSVFARPYSKRYNDILLTRLRTSSLSNSSSINGSLNVNTTIRSKKVPGSFNIYAMGSYNNSQSTSDVIYGQKFGGANTNPGEPVNTDRYSVNGPETGKFSGGASYGRDINNMDERRSNTWRMKIASDYHYTYTANDYTLFTADADLPDGIDPLPSLTKPEQAVVDAKNSYFSTNNDHNIVTSASVNFRSEPTAQVDSGLNPGYSVSMSIEHKYRSNSLDHNTQLPTHEYVIRRTNTFSPKASFRFSSQNKLRYIGVSLNYSMKMSEPLLNLFLHNRESSDPMTVYEYNADNLRMSKHHNLSGNIYRYGRAVTNYFQFYYGFNLTQDAIGNASIYNPETGVTIYKPMNINGNWNTNGSMSYSHTFGSRRHITLGGGINGTYSHSVDFHTTVGSPERSLVKNLNTSCALNGNYKFKNGSNISLGGSVGWRNSHGTREGFREISAMEYRAYLNGTVELPWDMQFTTNLNMLCNSGYDVAEMNEAQWLWNATLTKSILKGNLTFKLSANDILGQVKPYTISVNSQGRYETWSNTMRRYAMLTVLYRFNKHPKMRR